MHSERWFFLEYDEACVGQFSWKANVRKIEEEPRGNWRDTQMVLKLLQNIRPTRFPTFSSIDDVVLF